MPALRDRGQFVGGHGMSPDHRLKTASALSELWDGRPIKRVRAGDGVTILNGRRLEGSLPWANLKQLLDLEIAYQKVHHDAGDKCCEAKVPSPLP